MKVSVIIPVYNEEKVIGECLKSIANQSYKDLEVIVVDDGSTDNTLDIVSKLKMAGLKLEVLEQNHLGAGAARNLGVQKAKGETLVFVDADMIFDPQFIDKLTEPIREGETVGTFSKEEYVLNKDNVWSKCWNINRNLPIDRMHPKNYPDKQAVFRAILKKEFIKAGGFETIGYIDDHTLADKLGVLAVLAPGAVFYHRNPESLTEIYQQARWIGKSEFKRRKIRNESWMRMITLIRYSPPLSLINGFYKAVRFNLLPFLFFKIIYDLAIEISLLKSLLGEQKYR